MTNSSPDRGKLRAARAGALGAVSMVLATTAHLVGGGSLPPIAVLLAAGAVVGLIAVTVTARRCRMGVVVGLLGVEQLGLHWLFAGSAGGDLCVGSALTAHHAGSLDCTAMPAAAMAPSGPGMWLAHGFAVLATAWLLSRGEAWLWRLADRVVRTAYAAPARRATVRRPTHGAVAPVVALRSATFAPAAPRGPPSRLV